MATGGPKNTGGMQPSSQAYKSADYVTPSDEGMVVDLSEFAERIINYDDISADLSDEQERRIVDYVNLWWTCPTSGYAAAMTIGRRLIAPMMSMFQQTLQTFVKKLSSLIRELFRIPFSLTLWLLSRVETLCSSLKVSIEKVEKRLLS